MRVNEGLRINVNVEIIKRDIEGNIIEIIKTHNKATDICLDQIKELMSGAGSYPTHFAVGTGTTEETAEDIALEAEVYRDDITAYSDIDTGKWQYRYFLSSTDANGNDISEAGLFDALSGGNMSARVTFPADEKTSAESWTFNWTFTIARSG